MKLKARGAASIRYLKYIFLSLIAVCTVVFVLENQESVSVQILGLPMPELPTSLYMLLSLLMGLAMGPLLGWYLSMRRFRK